MERCLGIVYVEYNAAVLLPPTYLAGLQPQTQSRHEHTHGAARRRQHQQHNQFGLGLQLPPKAKLAEVPSVQQSLFGYLLSLGMLPLQLLELQHEPKIKCEK